MLLMMTARRALELAEWVKAGAWRDSIDARHYGIDVHHKTIGIVGMGRIGYALAQRAHAGFNMSVCYHSHHAHPAAERVFAAERCSLETLLARADFVCLTLPLTAQSQGLINAQRLAQMKPGAILINGARGKLSINTLCSKHYNRANCAPPGWMSSILNRSPSTIRYSG